MTNITPLFEKPPIPLSKKFGQQLHVGVMSVHNQTVQDITGRFDGIDNSMRPINPTGQGITFFRFNSPYGLKDFGGMEIEAQKAFHRIFGLDAVVALDGRLYREKREATRFIKAMKEEIPDIATILVGTGHSVLRVPEAFPDDMPEETRAVVSKINNKCTITRDQTIFTNGRPFPPPKGVVIPLGKHFDAVTTDNFNFPARLCDLLGIDWADGQRNHDFDRDSLLSEYINRLVEQKDEFPDETLEVLTRGMG